MIYLVVFAISIFFAFVAEKKIDCGKKGWPYLILAALGPIILAGLRGNHVGMDTYAYVIPTYKYAIKSVDFSHFLELCGGFVEVGYAAFVYVVAKFFGNMAILMFAIHLVIIAGIMYVNVCFKRLYGISICFSYAIMLFFLYNPSLTIMRQTMSFSIALVAMAFMIEKKYFKFAFFVCLSVLFHISIALFVVSFVLFYWTLKLGFAQKHSKWLFAIVFVLSFFIQSFIVPGLAMVDEKYVTRFDYYGNNSGGNVTIMLYGLWALIPFVLKKKMHFLFFLPIFGFAFQLLGKQSSYITRLAVPDMSMAMYTIPFVAKARNEKVLLLLSFVLQWIFSILIRNNWCSLPYTID